MDPIDWLESYFSTTHNASDILQIPNFTTDFNDSLFDFYVDYGTEWLKAQTSTNLNMIDSKFIDSIYDFAVKFVQNVDYIQSPIPMIFGGDQIYLRKLLIEINSQLYHQICVRLKAILLEYFQVNLPDLIKNDEDLQEPLSKIAWIFEHMEIFRVRKVVEGPIIDLLQTEVEAFVYKNSENQFEESMVQFYLYFLDTKLTGLISSIFGSGSGLAESWFQKLKFHIYRTMGLLLMDNIFEIVRDFPDTQPALVDLKLCLQHSGEISEFLASINSAMKSRLLIIDAKTTSILDMFLACKKCIAILELDTVSKTAILQPIKSCLTARKDVARIILSKILESSDPNSEESLEEEDIESILDIFPAREAFVKEFQSMLSEELIQLTTFDVDNQIRNVEILKSRFGDSEMAKAHVMMKDVADSRRIASHHISQNQSHSHFSSLVISDLFWPKVEGGGKINPPEIVMEWMQTYEKSFQDLKASRKLKWISEVGVVDIEVKRSNDLLRLLVSPIQASVLYLFSELGKSINNVDEILINDALTKIGCSKEQLRNAVKFWKSHSILDFIGDYIVSLEQISRERMDQILGLQAEGGTIIHVEESTAADEEIAEIWPMIEGMLTNLGPSDAGTIHRTLSMFMSDFNYDLNQFQKLLEQMTVQDKLEADGQMFNIKKS